MTADNVPSHAVENNAPMEALILRVATDPAVPVEKLERMLAMQERILEREARKAFDNAIADAKASITPIVKSAQVNYENRNSPGSTQYKYETFDAIARQIDPILSQNGLSYRFRSSQENNTLSVTCIIAHRDGHTEETSLSGPPESSGNKNGYQSLGSAATYLQRYTLKLALGLSAGHDDDAQGASTAGSQNAGKKVEKPQDPQKVRDSILAAIDRETTVEGLRAMWAADQPRIKGLPEPMIKEVTSAKDQARSRLTGPVNGEIIADEIPY